MPKTPLAAETAAAPDDDAAVWAAMQPRIEAMLQRKVDAMQRRIEARLVAGLARKLPDLYDPLEPMVRQMVRHKNDVQDDAIIGIGAKVDAQDEAIEGLVEHLRRVLAHPIFRA
jgi:hypothetical protein